jgi:glycosyltransferase involved in cell wall biosynthesis
MKKGKDEHMEKASISVVVPVYNEEQNIPLLYREIKFALDKISKNYEIVFVDDGSSDQGLSALREIASRDPLLKVLALARNRGQTAALVCGINYASGDVIVLMDGDLQNDPNDIPMLISKMNEGYDVVSGWRRERKDTFITRRLPSILANKLISWFCGVHLHDYGCTLKVYRASVLKDIRLYGEMHRFIPIYASMVGARITEVSVNHRPRTHGKSKYSMNRIIKVLLDLVTIKFLSEFETRPIYFFGASGMVCISLSFVCTGILFYIKYVLGYSMIQSPFLLLSAMLFILGVQSILLGLLAEMQIRTYFEVLNKPIYLIREKINL